MRCGWIVALGLGSLALTACTRAPKASAKTWWTPQEPYEARAGSPNGYDDLLLAAEACIKAMPDEQTRVHFTPGMKAEAIGKLGPALAALERGLRKPVEFKYRAEPPFSAHPERAAWRLLGRAVVWQVEAAVEAKTWDQAVRWALTGVGFGVALTGGDAADFSLGSAIADETRAAIAPALDELPAGQASRLADGLSKVLREAPKLSQTIDHEAQNVPAVAQWIEDLARAGRLVEIEQRLGRDLRPAVELLTKDTLQEREEFLQGMVDEGRFEAEQARSASALPAARRARVKNYEVEEKPWRRMTPHFLLGPRRLLPQSDRLHARLRLLAMTAWVRARVTASGRAPANLSTASPELRTDPYTGEPFIYQASGRDFRLYSVGEDLRDDAGDTDALGLEPDLVLAEEVD